MTGARRPPTGWLARSRSATALCLVAAAIVVWPATTDSARTLHLGVTGLLYATSAYGLAILYRATGLLSVAHAALWGIGAYSAVLLARDYDVGLAVALPVALVIATLLAVVVGMVSLRVPNHYFLIITFAVGELFVTLLNRYSDLTGGPLGATTMNQLPGIFGIDTTTTRGVYAIAAGLIIATLVLYALLERSALGRRVFALRENEALLRQLGVRTEVYRVSVFVLSSVLAATAGVIYGYFQHTVSPESFGSNTSLVFALMVIVGGSLSLFGPLIGAVIWVFLPEVLGLTPTANEIALGSALIVLILVCPEGLAGLVARGRQLATRVATRPVEPAAPPGRPARATEGAASG